MMKNPLKTTMEKVEMELSTKSYIQYQFNKSHCFKKRLDFLKTLPLEVFIEKNNKLIIDFENESVHIYPKNNGVSFANFNGAENMGCKIEMALKEPFETEYKGPSKIINEKLCGGTFYCFYVKGINRDFP